MVASSSTSEMSLAGRLYLVHFCFALSAATLEVNHDHADLFCVPGLPFWGDHLVNVCCRLSDDLLDHSTGHVCQSEISSGITIGQFFMIKAEQV